MCGGQAKSGVPENGAAMSCGGHGNAMAPMPLAAPIEAPLSMRLESADFAAEAELAATQSFDGFGCTGANRSPALSWSEVPEGTQSFALVVHDPDAPTGVGFFHWLAYDLPASTRALAQGAALPEGSLAGRNDYGKLSYGGPCPPPGPAHRYVFTLYALDVPTLGLAEGVSGALLRFNLAQHTLARGRLVGRYAR